MNKSISKSIGRSMHLSGSKFIRESLDKYSGSSNGKSLNKFARQFGDDYGNN